VAASSRKNGHLTTVDIADVNNAPDAPWREAGYQMSPADYAEKLNFDDRIKFIQSPAVDYMLKTNDRFDFIFLDGDHAPDAVYREVSAALNILSPGGVILLHDYYPDAKPLWQDGNIISGPFRALKRITNENKALQVVPLGDLPWPTKQGSHKTSLAIITKA
jgi:predicted O-methyltransferase YrrM